MSCKMCGKCCEVIALTVEGSIEELQKQIEEARKNGDEIYPGNEEAVDFMMQHWSEISQEEAKRRNPYIKEYIGRNSFARFYECDCFTEDRKCSIHDHKPPICAGFPFYGSSDPDLRCWVPDCGFNELKTDTKKT